MLQEGTFPYLKKRLRYFYFDECLRENASEENKRKAMREIYQTISRKQFYNPSTHSYQKRPESVLYLIIAIVSCLYRDLRNSSKVAEILGCSPKMVIHYVPQEMKVNFAQRKEVNDRKFIEVLDSIGPCSYEDLVKELGLTRQTVMNYAVRLMAEGKIKITRTPTRRGPRGGIKYSMPDLFDGLSKSDTRYMIWDPAIPNHKEKLTERFKEAILASGPLTGGKKAALTHSLKGDFPEDVFSELYEWYSDLDESINKPIEWIVTIPREKIIDEIKV